jgi:ribosome biogenesis protein Tsr3
MLRALILAVGLTSAVVITARAEDDKPVKPKRPQLTEEQKAVRKEITEKYDKDKDGKLSPDERKSISAEDKEKMQKAGIGQRKKKAE